MAPAAVLTVMLVPETSVRVPLTCCSSSRPTQPPTPDPPAPSPPEPSPLPASSSAPSGPFPCAPPRPRDVRARRSEGRDAMTENRSDDDRPVWAADPQASSTGGACTRRWPSGPRTSTVRSRTASYPPSTRGGSAHHQGRRGRAGRRGSPGCRRPRVDLEVLAGQLPVAATMAPRAVPSAGQSTVAGRPDSSLASGCQFRQVHAAPRSTPAGGRACAVMNARRFPPVGLRSPGRAGRSGRGPTPTTHRQGVQRPYRSGHLVDRTTRWIEHGSGPSTTTGCHYSHLQTPLAKCIRRATPSTPPTHGA